VCVDSSSNSLMFILRSTNQVEVQRTSAFRHSVSSPVVDIGDLSDILKEALDGDRGKTSKFKASDAMKGLKKAVELLESGKAAVQEYR